MAAMRRAARLAAIAGARAPGAWAPGARAGAQAVAWRAGAARWSSSDAKPAEQHGFQAETSKLLDIVTNSIYTDKKIFLRELVSNSADALEKFRHVSVSNEQQVDKADRELRIDLKLDEKEGTLTLEDSGIGMSKEEMMNNLGTIARSGSKAFVEAQGNKDEDVAKNVIGQFGVGFYSAFMVADSVQVFSKSATSGEPAHVWESRGVDNFTIREAPEFDGLGTRIVLSLKEDQRAEFTNAATVESVVKEYSNYVGFPVYVNDKKANEVSAIWTRPPSEIKDKEYEEFYQFCASAFDQPMYRMHFRTDVPIDLKALLFVPSINMEQMGMGRAKPGVSLYSRKVLLDAHSERLLPAWMRFVKGVVDSDDLPISLSRETMQDTRLLLTIQKALTRRVIKMLSDEAKKDNKKFSEDFASQFGNFLREGACSDPENSQAIAKLLRFSSSAQSADEAPGTVSLDEYISRCPPSQDKIYYLSAPSREVAEASPYYEQFKRRNIEVLFLYNTLDDFVMRSVVKYMDRTLVNAEDGLSEGDAAQADDKDDKAESSSDDTFDPLPAAEAEAVCTWIAEQLDDVVRKVSPSTRLRDSPAIIVGHESASLRRMMKMVQQAEDGSGATAAMPKQQMELNMGHPVVKGLATLRETNPELAKGMARQLFDNALISAGLMDDPRALVPRLNKLMTEMMAAAAAAAPAPEPEPEATDSKKE